MKRVCLTILRAAGVVLLAVLWLWFLPVTLFDVLTGDYARRQAQIDAWWHKNQRRLFDQWLAKENKRRHKRVWKNRNDFYK